MRSSVRMIPQMLLVASILVLGAALPVHAQFDTNGIAKTYVISGTTPVSGDIISLDSASQKLHLSDSENDPNVFGVVVDNPSVVLTSGAGGTPVVTQGEAIVNVTTAAGPIRAGDYIVASNVPGKGERATAPQSFVLGTALESFSGASTTTATSSQVYEGAIRVLVGVGPRTLGAADTSGTGTTHVAVSASTATLVSKILKYVLAALIAIGSIAIAFRNFGSSIKDSILSVGRNPLAKASIQSMVVLNVVLVLLISAAGLFVAFAVLFLPI